MSQLLKLAKTENKQQPSPFTNNCAYATTTQPVPSAAP